MLQKLGISLDALGSTLEGVLARIPKVSGGAQPQISRALSRVLEKAFTEAEALKDEYV